MRDCDRPKRERDYNAMEHCNGDHFVAMHVETTGPDPFYDEIIQVCFLALDAKLDIRKDVIPFALNLLPDHPERIKSPPAKMLETLSRGLDKDRASDMLLTWKDKLGLGFTEFGKEKKILPLAFCYADQKPFIQRWLGYDVYEQCFDYRYRDIMCAAAYLNEQASFHARKVPYFKLEHTWINKQHNVECSARGECVEKAISVAKTYKAMSLIGLL